MDSLNTGKQTTVIMIICPSMTFLLTLLASGGLCGLHVGDMD